MNVPQFQNDIAYWADAFIGFDGLNIAEPLRTAVLRRARSQKEVSEILKRKPPASETDVRRFQRFRQRKDAGAGGVPAVSPRKRVRPGINFGVVQKFAVDITRLQLAEKPFHDHIGHARIER